MRNRKIFSAFLIAGVIFFILNIYTLPYYVTKPGMALELDEVINIENREENEGKFMLTTVRVGKANIISFLSTKFNDYYYLEPINAIRLEDETDEEYTVRQMFLMEDSQEKAIQVAYTKAGKEVDVQYNGIYVLNVVKNSPAEGILNPGDRIIALDGQNFNKSSEFTGYIQSKNVGEEITVTVIRNGKEIDKKVVIDMIPEIDKPGIGISLVEDKEVSTDPPIEIDTEKIGGPSAGLMFTLEIYNQLVDEDITKGYHIAGTGTISVDGTVGPIGGIGQKVVAADQSGAEIFFAPNQGGKADSDYQNALKTAEDINTDMKIVPVDTFDDALKFLQSLEPKNK